MILEPAIKERIKQVIRCFETGSKAGNYGALAFYNDGPGDVKQVTYGCAQATEYSGSLARIINAYCMAGGAKKFSLEPYVEKIGHVSPSLAGDPVFIAALQAAGTDPVMARVQDAVFDRYYFDPAMHWCDGEGFTLPLSMLIAYDSWIHSGGILPLLRMRFPEMTPAHHGDERRWMAQYTRARDAWLKGSGGALASSSYRTKSLLSAIDAGNWDMSKPINANGVMV